MQYATNNMDVRLRAMEPEDLDLLYAVENNPEEWTVGNTTMPYSRDILRQYILSTTGDIFTDKQVRLIIEKGGNAIGIIDLTSFDPKNLRAEVGIMILPKYRKQGFATHALKLLEAYASSTVHLHQLYAIVPADNICSSELFKNRGFSVDCILKDWLFDGKEYHNAQLLQKII